MTRREVLEKLYRSKGQAEEVFINEALFELEKLDLTEGKIREVVKSVSVGNLDDNTRLYIGSILIEPLVQAILSAQRRKRGER